MSDKDGIVGAASIMGSATMLSRVLGYIRDAVIAYIFGASVPADAFFVAFRISNLFRRLVGEGALTSSFIPIFTELITVRSKEELRAFVLRFFLLFSCILIVLATLGVFFAPWLVRVMAPGFVDVAGKFALTVTLTRFMFPYVVFIGLMAIAMGILNSYRHFTAPALSPVLFNITIIFMSLVVSPFMESPIYALAIGVVIGGFFQFVLQLPFLGKYGMIPRSFALKTTTSTLSTGIGSSVDKPVARILLLMGPALLGIGVYQLNIFVTLRFASHLPQGSISYLYYAGRLMELPLGVFGVAIAQAVLPSLSSHVVNSDMVSFKSSLSFALRLVNFVNIPAMVGLFVLSIPIIDLLFVRGEFSTNDGIMTSYALYFYALGIVPVAASRIVVAVFYSLKDTKTPLVGALITFAVNIVLCFLLVGPMAHGGLALATSISSLVNLVFLGVMLRRRLGGFELVSIFSSGLKSSVAALLMGIVIYLGLSWLPWEQLQLAFKALALIVVIGVGVVVYMGFSYILKVPEQAFLKTMLWEKLAGKGTKKSAK